MFFHTFPVLWKPTFPTFWELYGFLVPPKYLRGLQVWNVCFFPFISLIMGIYFSHILGILWISASPKMFKKPINLKCLCFPYFSRTMEIQSFHVLETPWISAWSEKFRKPLTLKCLCFPIFFSYYENSLFPYFGNCMD